MTCGDSDIYIFVPLGIRNNDGSHSGQGLAFPSASGKHNRVIRVKAPIGSTKVDRLLGDRSKRIHTVIHMRVLYRNEEKLDAIGNRNPDECD